ncbi:hypothetical protein [Symbioplanes lichenis]|uniref:hypothetical protein n=1 Tax=Symbioplanes lichenis TaxID=1629072 RepID=UPI002739C893|nr:hypothetical protein [Actinoplanes lichenis]
MESHRPYESRDLELGAALRSWADRQPADSDCTVDGPLDAPGMDPTWRVEIRGPAGEAILNLFYGPVVDVTAVRRTDLFVGGAEDLTPAELVAMVDDLRQATQDGAMPAWLRRMPYDGPAH